MKVRRPIKKQMFLLIPLVIGGWIWPFHAHADKVISERKKEVYVDVPISEETLKCREDFDDYSNLQTSLYLDWDYRSDAYIQSKNKGILDWYSRGQRCPYLPALFAEASLHGGRISRKLTFVLHEKIGGTWGGCKRYYEERAEMILAEQIILSGFQFQNLEDLPMRACE